MVLFLVHPLSHRLDAYRGRARTGTGIGTRALGVRAALRYQVVGGAFWGGHAASAIPSVGAHSGAALTSPGGGGLAEPPASAGRGRSAVLEQENEFLLLHPNLLAVFERE